MRYLLTLVLLVGLPYAGLADTNRDCQVVVANTTADGVQANPSYVDLALGNVVAATDPGTYVLPDDLNIYNLRASTKLTMASGSAWTVTVTLDGQPTPVRCRMIGPNQTSCESPSRRGAKGRKGQSLSVLWSSADGVGDATYDFTRFALTSFCLSKGR